MSEWAKLKDAERALFSMDRNTLLQPDPMSPWWVRLLGYGWRLALLGIIGALITASCIFMHLRHPSFSQKVSQGLAKIGDLDKAKLDSFQWSGDRAKSRSFSGAGHAQSLIRTIEAEMLMMKLPFNQLWEKQWTIEEIHAARLTANIRGGAVTNFSETKESVTEEAPDVSAKKDEDLNVSSKLDLQEKTPDIAPPKIDLQNGNSTDSLIDEKPLQQNAFGIAPDPSKLTIQKLSTDDLTLNWGAGEYTKGSLVGSQFDLTRTKSNNWNIAALGGRLNLAWFQNVALDGLTALYTGKRLEFAESKFSTEAGQGVLSGHLTIEDAPQAFLQCQLINFPLDTFIEPIYRDHFSLVIQGPVQLRGSTNLSSGITTEGTVKIVSGHLRELPVLQSLAALTSRLRLRQLEITNGQMSFKTAQGRLTIDSFQAECGEDIRLSGQFSLEKNRFLGEAKIGLKSVSLRRVSPALVSQFFQAEGQDWLWLNVPIDGPLDTLTAQTAQAIARAHGAAAREATPEKK